MPASVKTVLDHKGKWWQVREAPKDPRNKQFEKQTVKQCFQLPAKEKVACCDWFVERNVKRLLIFLTVLTVGLACYGVYEFASSFPIRSEPFPLCAPVDPDDYDDPKDFNMCMTGVPRFDGNRTNTTVLPCGDSIVAGEICTCFRVAAAIETERQDPNNVFAVFLALLLVDFVTVLLFIISLLIDWRAKTQTFWRSVQPRFDVCKFGSELILLPVVVFLTVLFVSFSLSVTEDGFSVTQYVVVDTGKNPTGATRGQIDDVDAEASPAEVATFERATLTDCVFEEPANGCEDYAYYTLWEPAEATEDEKDPLKRIATPVRKPRVDCDDNKEFYITVKENLNEGVGITVGLLILEISMLTLDIVFVRHRERMRRRAASKLRKELKKLAKRKAANDPTLNGESSSSSSSDDSDGNDGPRHVFYWGDSSADDDDAVSLDDVESVAVVMCRTCSKDTAGFDVFIANGIKFHKDCFICDGCGKKFGDGGYLASPSDSARFLCDGCYAEENNTKCFKCQKPCVGNFKRVDNNPYHPECLTCNRCGNKLDGSFSEESPGKYICQKCADA